MIKYVSVSEMIEIEREADASGLSYEQMMENAGRGLAEEVRDAYSHLSNKSVLGLVGSGNNGGDTLVALALLKQWGWMANAYLARPRPVDDPLVDRLKSAGGQIHRVETDNEFRLMKSLLCEHAVVVDGVLGTGVRLPLKGEVVQVLEIARQTLNEHPEVHRVAVDCPSGVDCDSGEMADVCIPAELTVSMAAAKRGLLMFPAHAILGDLRFVGIGLGDERPFPQAWQKIRRFVVEQEWVRQVMPLRPLDAHKGTFGTALIVAGSVNYTGATWLAGQAAYRCGAGLVTLALPYSLHAALSGQFAEATWLPLPEEDGGIAEQAIESVLENLERVTAMLVGPGFGMRETTARFVHRLSRESEKEGLPPLVFDADGLKLLARLPDWFKRLPKPAVLTPHPGEMGVLTGLSTHDVQNNRVEIAEKFAHEWGHVLVLKGAFTVIAAPDGRTAVIPVASPALARAGTGDVLAGIIVGLRAQGVQAFEAAAAGAWMHAQAGLYAARKFGNAAAVLAGDVLGGLIEVLRTLA
jgi:NAD(P)H-hydrate epimerase